MPIASRKIDLFARAVALAMEPLTLAVTVLEIIAWIIGGALIIGAIGRYVQYRDNPSQSPIGQSLFLAGLGIVLLFLPIIGRYALPSSVSMHRLPY